MGRIGVESVPARKKVIQLLRDSKHFVGLVEYLQSTSPFDKLYSAETVQWNVASIVDIIFEGCRPESKGGWRSNIDIRLMRQSTEKVLPLIESELAKPNWEFLLLSPIYGLSVPDSVQLAPPFSCTVKRLGGPELSSLFEPIALVSPQVSAAEMKSLEDLYSIVLDLSVPKPHNPLDPVSLTEPTRSVERIVDLMSLYKEGDIYCEGLYLVPRSVLWPTINSSLQCPGSILTGTSLTLESADVPRIEEFAVEVQKMLIESQKSRKTRYIDVSIRYFSSSRRKKDLSDRLVDLVTAFEALASEDRGEITFTLSSRIATLSSSSLSDRARIFWEFRKLYSKRSKIVHGDANEPDVTREEILALERLYRLCLRRVLHDYPVRTKDELILKLDNSLLSPPTGGS